MNCKRGDLVVIVRAGQFSQSLIGRVRTVVAAKVFSGGITAWTYRGGRLIDELGTPLDVLEDCCLRPIRDNDGADETLIWAGKPERVSA